MARKDRERLQAPTRELETQDDAWRRTKEVLARLGDVRLAVPRGLLDELDVATEPTQPGTPAGPDIVDPIGH